MPSMAPRGGTGAPAVGAAPTPAPAPPVTTGAPTWADMQQQRQPTGHGQVGLPASPPPSYQPPPDPLIGQVMAGRYLVQKKLGEGGMGAVYLAQHTVLEKSVALKV